MSSSRAIRRAARRRVVQLVAEALIGGPVVGFWDSGTTRSRARASRGPRSSVAFKSHHQLGELRAAQGLRDTALIYVIRVSARRCDLGGALLPRAHALADGRVRVRPTVRRLCRSVTAKLAPAPIDYRVARMVDAVLHGSNHVHHWMRVPWKAHYEPFVAGKRFWLRSAPNVGAAWTIPRSARARLAVLRVSAVGRGRRYGLGSARLVSLGDPELAAPGSPFEGMPFVFDQR